MDFNNVRALHIPEGDVIKISIAGTVMWEKYFEQVASGNPIQITNGSDNDILAFTLYGKSTQDGTPTPTAPVDIVNVVNPTVTACGKNLWPLGDVDVVLNSGGVGIVPTILTHPLKAGTYTISGSCTSSDTKANKSLIYDHTNSKSIGYLRRGIRDSSTFTLINECKRLIFYSSSTYAGSVGETAYFKDIQIELGSTATEYEPYKDGGSVTINKTLCGIGDVKDELIVNKDGTGKFIQRINTIVLDGVNKGVNGGVAKSVGGVYYAIFSIPELTGGQQAVDGINMLNSHFSVINPDAVVVGKTYVTYYGRTIVMTHTDQTLTTGALWNNWFSEQNTAGTPVTVQYELVTPTETDLTAEEVNAILALKTFAPNTVISNDKGASMEVTYIGTH